MRMSPAKTPSNGDMKQEMAIYCNQARLPMEGVGHQPSHKTLDPQFVMPTRCAVVKVVQKLWKWSTNGWYRGRKLVCSIPT